MIINTKVKDIFYLNKIIFCKVLRILSGTFDTGTLSSKEEGEGRGGGMGLKNRSNGHTLQLYFNSDQSLVKVLILE